MQCDYFDAGACRSCTLLGTPYDAQVAHLQAQVAALLSHHVAADQWATPFIGPESGFRNKAKLVVGGRRGSPTLGILDADQRGVDLRHCGLHEPGLAAALPVLADFVADTGLTPYDVPRRTGELKHLLVTHSPNGELMVRFVLRSPGQLPRLRRALSDLLTALPTTRVVSVNLHPEHKAVLEGEEEVGLTPEASLPMRVNGLTLHLRPRSFFQTNTTVAAALYRQAEEWAAELAPTSVMDLFCGVGGFALHAARATGSRVVGVETSDEAVASARLSAREAGVDATFTTGDAETAALDADLVVVNPPRRGIGALAGRIEREGPYAVLYSSCSAESLARDLAAMPSYAVVAARLFDMFPQTRHHEVLVLLRRTATRGAG